MIDEEMVLFSHDGEQPQHPKINEDLPEPALLDEPERVSSRLVGAVNRFGRGA